MRETTKRSTTTVGSFRHCDTTGTLPASSIKTAHNPSCLIGCCVPVSRVFVCVVFFCVSTSTRTSAQFEQTLPPMCTYLVVSCKKMVTS
uniref:Uncharacterized protein n=1 Tax=Anopheles coluzzii TaxID=1518534 RepID=A0A6E8VXA1_ANOCL